MAAESTDKVIRQLRHVLGLDDGGLADAELLGGYVERRDAAAFERNLPKSRTGNSTNRMPAPSKAARFHPTAAASRWTSETV